ncbi:uncharacterized protein LOC143367988 [Andrena cerasifolii]|uniref:uncharacterized protein LOC143367988 n=1 Tax=Andrena cerasifolii TaxID=2819439 RepID=UPI004037D1C3
MASKRKTWTSKEEQFYMLEVFVDRLDLDPERTADVNAGDLIVRVRFVDLPEYEISIPKYKQIDHKENSELPGNSKDLKYGKSCLFAKTPSSLIKAMRCSPMFMEVYYKGSTSATKKNGTLLGKAKISLPACLCNRVSAARKEVDGLSAPCIAKDSFDLTDSAGNGSGTVSVTLRLSCFGSSIVKHFSLNEKSFVLEDSPLQKFLCPYLAAKNGNKEDDSKDENPLARPSSPPRVSMDDPGFGDLTTAEKLNDPKYRELVYRAYPNEPTCRCMPADRSTHPMECRSGCNRRCCMKLKDPGILATQKDRTIEDTMANTYCVNNLLPELFVPRNGQPRCCRPRLKGGGDIEQIYIGPSGYKWTDHETDYTWYDERNTAGVRLEGGGGGEKEVSTCSCSGGPVPVPDRKSMSKDNDVVAIFDACTPRLTSTGPKPGCVCPGKDAPRWPRGAAKCSKSPCMGIDCLIRAFHDAQDFVDSIGKVPGVQGLGLMDPGDSPYFGRDIDKDYVTQEPQAPRGRTSTGTSQVAKARPPCPAPCNVPTAKPLDDIHQQHTLPPLAPAGFAMPPRLGIVREAIPVLPETVPTISHARYRKKEEKKEDRSEKQKDLDAATPGLMDAELGPCGEPKCKSRRKRPDDTTSTTQIAASVSSKAGDRGGRSARKRGNPRAGNRKSQGNAKGRGMAHSSQRSNARNIQSTTRHRGGGSPHPPTAKAGQRVGRGRHSVPGPGGDRISSLKPLVDVSRRVMRWVYFVGDTYPGTNYGHRDCIDLRMRVPANMGWLWNTMDIAGNLKPRIGWRPGAIGRYLYEMLQDAKDNSIANIQETLTPAERRQADKRSDRSMPRSGRSTGRSTDRGRSAIDRSKSAPSRGRSPGKRRGGKARSLQRKHSKMEGEEDGPEAPPTLHIHRKDGTYYVTMYPIRAETTGEPRLSEPMKPLQFKIVKNKDDASVATSSTASDMEIEFSPPAAVSRYRKKPDVVHVDTQVRQQEILDAYRTDGPGKREKKGRKGKEKEKREVKKPWPGKEGAKTSQSRHSQMKK